MTPYILLELEDWFEDEITFVRTCVEPGTQAFDIGSNHGVYALAIAARLGQSGHVWAFEPTRKPLAMLRASVAENGFDHLMTIVDCALSD
ncbi:FkbM family methyltransferase [Azospirillum agricola]|uniref:FkbM family methyltransferase n=1 Tax=Azospirillum agricola TaxID=1720247 RepID=UPI000A1C9D0E|nr:FkbM family methyltransferase [Azospirillum agricola]